MTTNKTINILSIDGGGVRGLIPAVLLAEIERRTGRPIAELFDLVAGTSIGGVLALALARPREGRTPPLSAQELVDLFQVSAPRVFDR